jgi:importin-8
MPAYYNNIEGTLKPLFEYMLDPNQMEFDEDIVLIMKTLMKKNNAISEIVWTLVPTLEKVFIKNKESMGNLLPTINHILIYGKDLFTA